MIYIKRAESDMPIALRSLFSAPYLCTVQNLQVNFSTPTLITTKFLLNDEPS